MMTTEERQKEIREGLEAVIYKKFGDLLGIDFEDTFPMDSLFLHSTSDAILAYLTEKEAVLTIDCGYDKFPHRELETAWDGAEFLLDHGYTATAPLTEPVVQ